MQFSGSIHMLWEKLVMPTLNKAAKILIAAEQPLEAQALDSILRGAGYRDLRTTSDGREVVPLFAKWPFEVLLLDMGLRTPDSLDIMATLIAPIVDQRLTVIALTDEVDERMLRRAQRSGASDVLTRPFTRDKTLLHLTGLATGIGASAPSANGAPGPVFRPVFRQV